MVMHNVTGPELETLGGRVGADISTADVGAIRLQLRTDLRVTMRRLGGKRCWMMEDLRNGTFYQLGFAEYTIISLFDGTRSISDVVQASVSVLGKDAYDEPDVAELGRWLIEHELASTPQSASHARMRAKRHRRQRARNAQWLNPLMLKFSCGSPDAIVSRLHRAFRWLIPWPALILTVLAVTMGLSSLVAHGERFAQGIEQIFTASNWLYLFITWVAIKFLHELGHALVCKHWGGEVRDCGWMLIVLFPVPYVDVTSAWRFDSSGKRILTSSAGMLVELLVAAIAISVWCRTEPGVVNQIAYNIVLTAGLMTLLVNANPLMRFDGYYILSDWWDLPNLAEDGQQFVHGIARRLFFGLTPRRRSPDSRSVVMIRCYGLAAFAWRIVVFCSVLIAASNLTHGIGLVLALLAAAMCVLIPFASLIQFLVTGTDTEQPNRLRFGIAVTTVCLAILGAGRLLPAPHTVTVPAIIEYDPLNVVRATTPGEVVDIVAQPNQFVSRGATLLRLRNRELEAERTQLRTDLARIRLLGQQHLENADLAQYTTSDADREALEVRQAQLDQAIQELTICARDSGTVLSGSFDQIAKTWVRQGQVLLEVGNPDCKKAILLIRPNEAARVALRVSQTVELRLFGRWSDAVTGTITRIDPRVTTELPHQGFAAPAGGSLAVVAHGEETTGEVTYQLVEPHIAAEVSLSQAASASMLAGQLGQVRIAGSSGSLGSYVWEQLQSWLRHKLHISHGV